MLIRKYISMFYCKFILKIILMILYLGTLGIIGLTDSGLYAKNYLIILVIFLKQK